jgi:translation initiation factor 2B subunit (eIF-2B alpha/beta/delta family)
MIQLCVIFPLHTEPLLITLQSFANLKTKLIQQGRQYATEALTYRKRIAELAVGFIKDGSVVSVGYSILERLLKSGLEKILTHSYSRVVMQTLLLAHEQKRISGPAVFYFVISELNLFGLSSLCD